MKKNLLTIFALLILGIFSNISAQNVIKQCTPGAFYYSCGAAAAHQSEQGPWLDLVINGNQNSWYQGYGIESASWKEFDNGTAQLTARLYQVINKTNVKFDMHLTFSNKGASTPHGGGDGWHCLPSNTSDWYYYRAATGSVTGVAGTHVQGVTFTASLVGGSALQIGTGGSINSTTKYGMSAWLNLTQTGGWNTCWKKGGSDIYFDLKNCTTVQPPTVTCSGNLIQNSGFESDLASWNNWGNTVVSTSSNSGSKAASVCGIQGGAGNSIAGVVGATYTLTAYAKVANYPSWAGVGIAFYDANWNKITEASTSVTASTYTKYTATKVAPSGTVYVQAYLWKGANGCLYTDDFCLTKTDPAVVTTKTLTIKNTGSCPVEIYHWLTTGDVYKTTIQAGGSWTTATQEGQMWRAINTTPVWTALKYDQHYTVNANATQTWTLTPTYCVASCNNLTSGGSIGSDQNGCAPYNSVAINSITLPSGGDATKGIEYVWLKTTDPNGLTNLPTCDANGVVNLKSWQQIAGATASSYSPGTVSQTTWYLRCARRAGCVCYYGESNIVKINITGNCPAPCNNLTSGGSIGSDQNGCAPYNSVAINNITLPSGGDVTKGIEYVWLKTTDPNGLTNLPTCDANGVVNLKSWQQIAGATTSSYSPGTVSQTTWYLRCARRAGCACYYGESNIVKINITGNCITPGTTPPPPTTCTSYTIANANGCTPGTYALYLNGKHYTVQSGTFTDNANGSATLSATYVQVGNTSDIVKTNITLTGRTTTAGVNSPKYELCINSGGSSWYYFSAFSGTITQNGVITNISNIGPAFQVGNGGNLNNTTFGASAWFKNTGTGQNIGDFNFSLTNPTSVQATITGNLSICAGQTTTLTAQGTGTYLWSNGSTAQTINVGAGTYTVTVSNGYCTATASTTVTAAFNPAATITGNLQVCTGQTTTLTAQGGTTYKWSNGATTQSITIGVGSYSVEVTNAAGCKATASATVTTVANPIATITGNLSICAGQTTTLTAQGTGTYLWSNGSTAQSITVGAGTYSVEITSGAGCKATASATVTKIAAPIATITGVLQVCNGSTTTLTAQDTGTYLWSNGSTAQSITVGAGIYGLEVTNTAGCKSTASVVVTTVANPIASITGNLQVCTGQTTTLTAQGTGTYLWSNGSTAQTINVGAGTYSVEITSGAGCKATASATVTTTANPTATITGGNTTVCNGGTTTLTAQGGVTYLWSNGSIAQTINIGAGTYTVTVSNGSGCSATASTTINNNSFSTSITGNLQVCVGQTTTLTAQGGGIYLWSNGSTAQSIAVGAGTYSVEVTNAQGCKATASTTVNQTANPTVTINGNLKVCNGATTTLTASGSGSFTWSNGATGQSITVGAGTYTVTVSNGVGCSATASATVTNSNVTATITGEPTVCPGSTTTLTANGGNSYLWSNGATSQNINVGAGTYSVTVTNVQGCTATNSITVTNKNCNSSSVGDFVFCDKNANGVQDGTEPGIAGVTVTLNGTDINGQPVTRTTTTDANGKYNFDNLPAGTYTVTFTKPNSYQSSNPEQGGNDSNDSDANPITGTSPSFTLGQGQNNSTIDAGFYQLSTIGNFVFDDKDNDGVQDAGELGIAGVTVTLTGTAGDGSPVSLTTVTDSNGNYQFTNVKPGTYTLNFGKPTGFNPSPQNVGTDDNVDSDTDSSGNVPVTVTSGTTNNTIDAGFNKPVVNNASLGDYVFCDKNGNGVQDAGDTPLAGVTVTLTGTTASGQTVTKTAVTDATGKYTFTGLEAGTYKVTFGTLAGYVSSPSDKGGNDAIDSDAINGMVSNIVLVAGQNNPTIDAGFYQLSTIGNFVFDDQNNNGVQNLGELGLAGVTVTLTGTAGDGSPVSLTTITDANGNYQFTNVKPGIYTLNFGKPTGFNPSLQNVGTDDNVDSDTDSSGNVPVTVTSGTTNNTVDAGFNKPAPVLGSIGDIVFNDLDKDGVQDAGETGIPNVTVILNGTVNGNPITLVTTTDANGKYNFPNLQPGTYTLTFSKPAGYTASPADQGGNDATDSDANSTTGVTPSITIVAGTNNTTIDAGFYLTPIATNVTIGDFVFLDCNKNGIQDANEGGVANVKVELRNAAGTIVATTTTNASGAYSFTVPAGSYKVCFKLPTNYTGLIFSPKDAGGSDMKDSDVSATGETDLINFTANNNTVDAGIIDNIAPVLNNFPANVTVACTAIPVTPNITATDNYDASVTIMKNTTTELTGIAGQYLLKHTFKAVDKCGNITEKTWTICVKDTDAPTFTSFPADKTVECDAIPAVEMPNVSDACDSSPEVDYDQTIVTGSCVNNYTIKRIWTVTDAAGNKSTKTQTITVRDTKAPVITGVPADVTITCGQAMPLPPAPGVVKATDNCDAFVNTHFSEIFFAGDCDGKGMIKCQWLAKDKCGNITTKIWTITIFTPAQSLQQNTNNTPNSLLNATGRTEIKEATQEVVFTNNDVNVFPNPTYGDATILLGDVKASRINVVNEIGQIVQTIEQPTEKVELNLARGAKGLYTIQIYTATGILTKKLVVVE